MLYFFIIPQNGKSSVQKARESSRVHVHFGIFSPIFFNTFVNLKVVLMFLRTFSWDFFRTWARNFPLGRFNSIKVFRTSGSILFRVKCHNSKKKYYSNHTMFLEVLTLFLVESSYLYTRVVRFTLHFTAPAGMHCRKNQLYQFIYLSLSLTCFVKIKC